MATAVSVAGHDSEDGFWSAEGAWHRRSSLLKQSAQKGDEVLLRLRVPGTHRNTSWWLRKHAAIPPRTCTENAAEDLTGRKKLER